jgi:hypothetical protein
MSLVSSLFHPSLSAVDGASIEGEGEIAPCSHSNPVLPIPHNLYLLQVDVLAVKCHLAEKVEVSAPGQAHPLTELASADQ